MPVAADHAVEMPSSLVKYHARSNKPCEAAIKKYLATACMRMRGVFALGIRRDIERF